MAFRFIMTEENAEYNSLEFMISNFGFLSEKRFGCGIKNGLIFGRGSHAEVFIEEKDIENESNWWSKFFLNGEKFRFFINQIKNSSSEIKKEMKNLLIKDFGKLDDEHLLKFYNSYNNKLGSLMNCYIVPEPHRTFLLEEKLVRYLKDKGVVNLPKAISILTSPKNKVIFLKAHNKIFTHSLTESSKVGLKNIVRKRSYNLVKADERERIKLMRILKPEKEIVKVANILRILAEERLKMRFTWMPAIHCLNLFSNEFVGRYGVPRRDLKYFDSHEIRNLIRHGKKVDKKTLIMRRKFGILKLLENGSIKTFEGRSAQKLFIKLTKFKRQEDIIKGATASSGRAVGRVVVLSYREPNQHFAKIQRMKMGDIVVTEMTRPNIITACEKAGAIVTDEGGLLSHAAIISRELKIPCITGTEIATRVLKDGDIINVDANFGTVRKLTLSEFDKLKDKFQRSSTKELKTNKRKEKMNEIKLGDIFWLRELSSKDLPTVGGKGANLGELYKFANVPNGFCISVNAYKKFMIENNLFETIQKILQDADLKNPKELESKSQKIRALITGKKVSKTFEEEILASYEKLGTGKVAVRSSATAEDLPEASFAGQQDTYLNVSNFSGIIRSILKCWASLFNARAIYYREKNNFIHENVLASVVIQKMVNSKYAGVTFTLDPIRKQNMIIEAVEGSGEKLVGGTTTPNKYILDRSFEILEKTEKFKIEEKILVRLAKICKKIEKHFSYPQDIEWAIDDKGKIFILQARPITTGI